MTQRCADKILYIAQNDPWHRWSSSGFLRSLCTELRDRGHLLGALPYYARSDRHGLGYSRLGDLRERVLGRLGYRAERRPWRHESEGPLGRLIRALPARSPVVYQYTIPRFDSTLPLRRFVFQDLSVLDAVRTRSYGHDGLSPAEIRRRYKAHRRALHGAEGVLTFSNYAAESIARDFDVPRDRITAIGCGPVRSRASMSRLDDDRYAAARVLFVGRNWERKGGPTALRAFTIVRQVVPHATLTIVGPRERPAEGPGVRWYGRVSDRVLARIFAQSSLFMMPAVCEAWGIVYVEAASAGLPIVGFRRWAMPDIVEDGRTGRLTQEESAEALAEAAIEILRTPERMVEMGTLAQERVRTVLDWPHVVDRLLSRVLPGSMKDRCVRRLDGTTATPGAASP